MKRLLLFAIFLVALLSLTACGNTRCEGGCMPGEYVRTVDSTCTTHGYDLYACPECGFETDRKELPLVECQAGTWQTSTSPTCTEAGIEKLPCQWCGKTMDTNTIAATGHDVSNVENWDILLEATCTREGKKEGRCPSCYSMITQTIPVTDHIISSDWVTKTAATCLTKGERIKKCSYASCNKVMESEEIPALNHEKAEEWVTTVPFTCTTDGEEAKKCIRCPEIMETRVVEAHHVKVTLAAVETTCTAPGKTEGLKCSGCNEVYTAQEEIPQLPHTWVIDTYVAPTCQDYGYTEGSHCDVCKKWQVKPTQISKLPHQTVTDKGYAATCTSSGKTDGKHCSVCQEITQSQSTLSALGHDFSVFTNTCTRCPEKEYREFHTLNETQSGNKTGKIAYFLDTIGSSILTITIAPQTTHLRLISATGRTHNAKIVVSNRTTDLHIELVNTTLTDQDNVLFSETSSKVYLTLYGQCGLVAKKANNGADASITSLTYDGQSGSHGKSAIYMPKADLYITVAGNDCVLLGGDGGNGGKGMDAAPSPQDGGDGGHGGNGGVGINASSITVTFADGYNQSNLGISGGAGGSGGKQGAGFLWGDDGRAGNPGSPGNATSTEIIYK